jgi:hypothetical protein
VAIGQPPPLATAQLGRITICFHPVLLPWRFDAVCAYDDGPASRADAALIALAGPAASLLTGLAAWAALLASPGATMVDGVLGIVAFASLATTLVCLTPLTLTDSSGTTLRTDGAVVLTAVR